MWSVLASLVLVAGIGFACQRGNTCAVATVDDLVYRRSPARMLALVYTWAIVAGGLAIVHQFSSQQVSSSPITWWSALGGVLLGTGAVVNGSCTTGTVCRIGSGEYKFLATVAGFFLGCVVAPTVLGASHTESHRHDATSATLQHPWIAVVAGAIALGIVVVRCTRSGDPWSEALRRPWDPRVASAVIALLFVAACQIHGRWSYTDLLGDIARGKGADIGTRTALLLALFLGAVVGGRTQRGTRPIGPLTPQVVRCAIGGTLMGLGFSLTHSAFDGITFVGQPLLLPLAWVTMAATYGAITVGIAALRSARGDWVKSRRGTKEMPVTMFSGSQPTSASRSG
jgi:toxin CptA